MSANRVLFDEPGPRGRRRIRILTVLSTIVIAAVIAVAVQRFATNGQLAAEKWKPFTLPYVQKFLWDGLQSTLQITVVSGVLALPLGVLFALLRLSHRRAVRWIATSYVEVFRSLPLLLILVFVLALPPLGVNPPIFWKVVIPIVMCNVAVLAEIFRAGINAVPKGQTEAALAVGLTRGQAIREVVLPQAVRMIIPSLVTQLVSLLKDSTLGYAASFAELLRTANVLTARLHIFIQVYIVISLIYIVINLLLSYLSRVLERRLNRVRRTEGPAEGVEQEVLVMSMETAPGGSLMRLTVTAGTQRRHRQPRNISATRKASSSDCWVFSRGSHAVS